jgi:hypothetical protein
MSDKNQSITLAEDDFANMFSGIKNGTAATSIKADSKLAIAIVGKPKAGKSLFAASAPGPVYVADFDNRSESLQGKAGVFVKTYFDKDPKKPTAMIDLETDLNYYKDRFRRGLPTPKTYVLDSMTYMRKFMEYELILREPSLGRSVRVSPTRTITIPSGWDVINAVRQYMDYFISEFRAIGNIITVWHENAEKDKIRSKGAETVYTGRYTVDPQYLSSILSSFNEVWRIDITPAGKYEVQLRPDYSFTASTTLKVEPGKKEPDISKLLAQHNAAL